MVYTTNISSIRLRKFIPDRFSIGDFFARYSRISAKIHAITLPDMAGTAGYAIIRQQAWDGFTLKDSFPIRL